MQDNHPSGWMKAFEIRIPGDDQAASFYALALITLRTLFVLGFVAAIFWWFVIGEEYIVLVPQYVSLYLMATEDSAWLLLGALAIPLLVISASYPAFYNRYDAISDWATRQRHPVGKIAFATLVICGLGSYTVYHAFPLSLDEYLAWFQARIFLGGNILAPIPQEWDAYVHALQPIFMRYDHANALWVPGYRPLGGGIIALFELVGAGTLANSVLAAGSVVLVALTAKKLWPTQPYAPAVAALFLALSPQFLITGMSAYAMTSHLFFNLLWLVLFLRNDKLGHVGAALAGFVAIGLHQVHIHPFFILPFMLYLIKERRYSLLLFYAVWYSSALLFWIAWRDIATALAVSGAVASTVKPDEGMFFLNRVASLFGRHNLVDDTMFWTTNLARFISWQAPVVLLCAYVGIKSLADAPYALRLLAWGILSSLLPYIIFMPGQGHGWGYRYLHVTLGSVSLLGVHGLLTLWSSSEAKVKIHIRRILVAFLLVGAFIGIPLRMAQVEHFIRPFAQASEYVSQSPHETIIINAEDIWFGVDLVRNDPYLHNTPKILSSISLGPKQLEVLCATHTPVIIGYEDLAPFGMRPSLEEKELRTARSKAFMQRASDASCIGKGTPS